MQEAETYKEGFLGSEGYMENTEDAEDEETLNKRLRDTPDKYLSNPDSHLKTMLEIKETTHGHYMTFPEAIAEATIGKRIQRVGWPENEYGYFKDEFLTIKREGDEGYKDYLWVISKGDVVEEDWISF
jgi:hypothetical protein